jgi:hypothetical protein
MLALALAACSAEARGTGAKATVKYAEAPAWAEPPPIPTETASPAEAPLRVIYSDTQTRVLPSGVETFSALRIRVLKPEALPVGNLAVVWNPASGDATIHAVKLVRSGQTIDVLKDQRFAVIQREGALEQSVITGNLTAALQVPGLQVGDELEFAYTVRSRDPTVGDHAFGLYQLPVQGMPGTFRYSLSWPDSRPLTFRGSRDLAAPVPTRDGGARAVSYELRDPRGAIVNDGAPARYNVRRLIEFSEFRSWSDVSKRYSPLFADAASLTPKSPLRAEIARIETASSDPVERATAALKLVQDSVRYVYVGLDGGNYRPASIDETWARRFGDCKAKTVLLLALLRGLGIESEAVLVNVAGDDGLDGRLPSPAVFNHVLVRARIGGKYYWLDGTRLGDRYMDMLPEPAFLWALPLREAGAALEPVKSAPYSRPQFIGALDMDASAGFDKPAKVTLQYVIRGDEAYAMRTAIAALSSEDADRALRGYWREQEGWVTPDRVAWRYDERRRTISLDLVGAARADWSGDDARGHNLTIWGAGFTPPDILRRPHGQNATLPWLTDYPKFKCWAATIRLPRPGAGHSWTYSANPMNLTLGGVTYWRQAGLRDGTIRTVMSRSVQVREISPEQAAIQTAAIPTFDNNMSSVFETAAGKTRPPSVVLPFGDSTDWATDDAACIAKP